jgi:HD-GYP domain-containing protein (c-di-GMP phosphodiesterase class II)
MPRNLRIYITGVVALGALALVAATLVFPVEPAIQLTITGLDGAQQQILGIVFWTLLTLVASALPVQFGTQQAVSSAPILAATFLGGPAVGAWVAAIGSTEVREVRGRIPWYGSLANHAGIVLPVVVAGTVQVGLRGLLGTDFGFLVSAMVAAGIYLGLNLLLASALLALRTSQRTIDVLKSDLRAVAGSWLALAPLAWLMALIYVVQWWATLLFSIPLYSTRAAYQRVVEMRDMFTQTIGALAEAVDKRDPYTAKHSHRVKEIAVDIGRVMHVSDSELEALEWGGLLHDVGKIGVPDNVLLKQERLNREERMIMNAHPVLGAQIIAPVTKLAPELPIIRHHHEWYNGSGYPDRLIGDEIPKLARILHVADAFEAMTAARPYRMTPLTTEQALAELRKFAGIQFDPVCVDAFVRTHHVDGVPDPGRTVQPRPIPLIGQVANRAAAAGIDPTSPATELVGATGSTGTPSPERA